MSRTGGYSGFCSYRSRPQTPTWFDVTRLIRDSSCPAVVTGGQHGCRRCLRRRCARAVFFCVKFDSVGTVPEIERGDGDTITDRSAACWVTSTVMDRARTPSNAVAKHFSTLTNLAARACTRISTMRAKTSPPRGVAYARRARRHAARANRAHRRPSTVDRRRRRERATLLLRRRRSARSRKTS